MDMMLVGFVAALAAVGFLAFSFLKVDTPVVEEVKKERKQKQTKQDKVAARAAAASKKSAASDADDAVAAEKAERKRLKDKEKKIARRANAAQATKDAAAAVKAAAAAAAAPVAEAAAPAEGDGKKKKKKKKSKAAAQKEAAAKEAAAKEAAAAAALVEEEEEEEEEEAADEGWVEIPVVARKEKVVVAPSAADAIVFSDEILIQSDKMALVIGTGGATLQLIQSVTKTNIDVPKRGGVRSHTFITGPDAKSVAEAKAALQQLITKGYSSITHEGHVDAGISVPSKFIGQIIGPGGSIIKLLQKTGCKINTPKRDEEGDLVTVVGDDDKVKEVIKAIQQIMDMGFSSMTHEGWVAKTIMVPRDQIGGVIGPAGVNIKKLQDDNKCRINIPNSKEDPCNMSICGEAADVEICYAKIALTLLPPEPEDIPFEWSREAILAMDLAF